MYFATCLVFGLVFFLLALGKSAGQIQCNDCCNDNNHAKIDEPRRSIKSVWKTGQVALCDRALPWGWYRFTSFVGGEMPTSVVNPNHCGTIAPIWLDGTYSSHPTSVQDGVVTAKACINLFGIKNGCSQSFKIGIKRCVGDFYVYYLKPTYSCAIAYCAGTKTPCPYGKLGQPDNCYDPPTLFNRSFLGEPVVSYIDPDPESASVTLQCNIPLLKKGIQSWKNVSYRITWYSEGKHLFTDTICGNLAPGAKENDFECPGQPLISKLDGSKYSLHRLISCNVSARYTNSTANPWCLSKTARQPFFAGIQVHPTTLRLTECSNEVKTITLTPTIPVKRSTILMDPTAPRQRLTISFWLPKGIELDNTDCNVEMSELQSKKLRVIAKCISYQGSGVDKFITPTIEGTHSKFWNRNSLPAVWVSVTSSSDKVQRCQSYTDPHYESFGYHYFTFMGHGDFILYRNEERNFEVHTRQWVCSSGADTCNCGMVVRDHNDVIEFNCCNENRHYDRSTPVRVKVRSKKRLAPGISIKQTIEGFNSQYVVLFPSGAKVDVYRNNYGLNIVLQVVRAKHESQEAGLCLYNGSTQNINAFGSLWRLDFRKSYFDTLPNPIDDSAVEYNLPCSCHKTDQIGNPECKKEIPLHFPNVLDNTGKVIITPGGTRRRRDSYHYSDDLTDKDFELFKNYVGSEAYNRYKRAVIKKPKFTKENATLYCMEKVSNTEVGKLCAKLGANVQAKVDSCSLDLELTGETSFAVSAVSILMNECGEIAGRNLSSYINESSGEKPDNSSILSGIAEQLCPNDCTFNGRCVNGSCICNKGYTANDCAISTEQIPDISMLQGNGLCDRRQRPCRKVTVMGNGFLNSTNLTCHVVEFKVTTGSWTPNNTELQFPGIMTDLVLVDCYLPQSPVIHGYYDAVVEGTPAAGLMISVSNDGEHRSKKNLTLISYDSGCMSCNVSSGCFLKSNACVINRYCFTPNEVNPNDWCYQCLPDINKNAWTKRQVNLQPQFSSTTKYYAIFQEHLELAIGVADPEGMPVTVTLMSGSPSTAIMRDNVLIWNATIDAATKFFLKATDACGAFSTLEITVSLVVCPCQNGSCVPHPSKPRGSGYYKCDCLPGFTGDKCETNIDECQSYPCYRGRCVDGVNTFTCICYSGFVGRKCETNYDDCSSSPCIHGNCTDYVGGYGCSCEPGYKGKNCTIDIDECASSPCQHGVCLDQLNNYTCQCQAGYTGYDCDVDIDECQSSPCVHGTCLDKINSFACICPTGFTGVKCEENINDCRSSPCINGSCIDLVNNYTCNCYAGFTGPNCGIKITNCTDDSCYPNVTCFKKSEIISCGPCPFGFSGDGKNCEDIDYCFNKTCGNGGSCVDGISNFSCKCLAGFTGHYCQTDIDECFNHTCINGGSCVDGVNNYSCNCQPGFTGDRCETDIDECVNHTCRNGGSCVDGINNYSCNCQPGFTGDRCGADIDECVNHTCRNGGSCVDGINNYSCNCLVGFIGDHCEINFNDCVNHTCRNGGSCVDGINSYSCNCQQGFTGDRCETVISTPHTKSTRQPTTSLPAKTPISIKTTTTTASASTKSVKRSTTAPATSHEISVTSTVQEPAMSSSINEVIPTSEERSKTTTPTPTTGERETKQPVTEEPETEKPETEVTVELSIEMKWNNDLEDKTSDAFKKLSRVFENEIQEQYSQDDGFVSVEILSFRQGSVVVEFKLTFKTKLENEEALAPLKEGVKDGRMGSLKVDPKSLKVKRDSEEPTKPKIAFAVIIGISCGGVFLLAVVTACVVRHCQRRTMGNRRRVSDVMPAEVSFPRREKYELEERKEDIVRYEEVAISAIGVHYEELGNSNEAVRYEKLVTTCEDARYVEAGPSTDAGQYDKIGISNKAVRCEKLGTSGEDARYVEAGPSTGAGQYEDIGISNDAATYEEVDILNKAMQQ